MPDVKKKSSARYFKSLALGALFPFKLPWVETQTVGLAARPTGSGSIAKAMHGPCAIFVRRVAALSEPYRGVGVGGRGGLGEGGSGKGGDKKFCLS